MKETFVGRDTELHELLAALPEVESGRGRLFLIAGEPGIGKTRLATQLTDAAQRRGFAVLWGRCWEGGGAPAYWPWLQVLRGLARSAPEPLAHEAALLLAALTQLGEAQGESTQNHHETSEQQRFALFDRAAEFLRRVSAEQPLAMVLDDLHDADSPSLLLLQFVAREVGSCRVLLLGTFREVEVRQTERVTTLLTRIGRAGRTLPLRGLSESETAQVVGAVFAVPAAPALVHAIHQASEGNPFFIDEIARLLRAEGQLDATRSGDVPVIPIPHAVRETIQARVRRLPESHRDVLSAAAVLGREFDLERLTLVAQLAADELLEVLAQGEQFGLVVRRNHHNQRFGFAHALIRGALLDGLSSAQQAALHRRVAEGLAGQARLQTSVSLAELAHHFSAAGSEVADAAIDYCERAGRAALQAFGYELASEQFRRALDVLSRHRPDDLATRGRMLLELGEAHARAWETAEARQALMQAAELARRLNDADLLARAALGVGGLELGVPRGSGDASLITVLHEALEALGKTEGVLRARLLSRLAIELYYTQDTERRDRLTREAIGLAERSGDAATLAYTLSARHFALWATAPFAERLALADAVIAQATAAADPEVALQGRTWRVLDLIEVGDASLDEELLRYEHLAGELRQPRYLGMSCMLRGMRAQAQGRYADAERLAMEALTVGERVGDPSAFASAHLLLFAIRRDQGRLAELEPVVQMSVVRLPDHPVPRCFLALLHAELGRPVEARGALDVVRGSGFEAWRAAYLRGTFLGTLATVVAVVDAREVAAELYAFGLQYAGQHVSQGPNAYLGPCDYHLGKLAMTLRRPIDALGHFETALALSRRSGAIPWVARCLFEMAEALEQTDGEGQRRQTLLAEALQLAERLGMAGLVETIRSRHEARPTPAAETMRGGEGVFRRDGDYWTLSYVGTTSRLRDSKGLRFLAELLRRPRREVHVLELDLAVSGVATEATPGLDAGSMKQLGLRVSTGHDVEPLLDAKARAAYRERLETLREELETAEELQNSDRATSIRGEIEALAEELAVGLGLGGRARKRSSAAELVRQNVSRAIKSAIDRIRGENPQLALYLDATIKKGAFCSYNPDSRIPVRWTF